MILYGKKIAEKILRITAQKIKSEKLKPSLAVVLIGENKASRLYVSLKAKAAEKIGVKFSLYKFKENAGEREIIEEINSLNKDSKTNGIIVQLPLPKKYNTQKIINSISPRKDVDGFSAKGGSASGGHPNKFLPVFPRAILELIKATEINLRNKKAVIVGNSKIFGETMKKMLEEEKIQAEYALTPTLSRRERGLISQADILISAVGKPGIIKGEMIKSGVIIIDGGITKVGKKVLGDADFNSTKNKASYITPVPGGVGPVTIACLLRNIYLAAKK
ncbi:MAG: bifunctional 5,10-methylenetetrahydrofolate dehydrogenase/5,10-methenyltetrahydrofolate cyclohydrolase [Candidatus Moranbacteria bacterium]|nr:bifunctional 5,10-methylenetetrahydrofolate dehydrogenase/5,10-methenyltetrahydrofolate cyclohydrolase [Candidatus Moranbacteria bacterium]